MNTRSVHDHGLRPSRVVERSAERGADRSGENEDDAEQAKLGRAPAEHGRGIDAAESEHGAETVGIEHARKQEQRDLPVIAHELLHRAHELPETGADRAGIKGSRARPA